MNETDLVIFTYNFPYGNGETFLSDEVSVLARSFKSIHIFPLFHGGSKIPRIVPANVTYSLPLLSFDIKHDKLKFLTEGIFSQSPFLFAFRELKHISGIFKKSCFKNWLVSSLLIRILTRQQVLKAIFHYISDATIIYFYWGDKSSGIVPFLRKQKGNPIVVRFHGSDLYEKKNGCIPYRRRLLENLDYAVCISDQGRNYLANKYKDVSFKAFVFKLGVKGNDLAKPSTDDVIRLVSCSNVIPLKRVHLIYDAIIQLPFKVIWTHIGGGSHLDELKQRISNPPAHISVILTGRMNNENVLQYYRDNPVDLFLNVSESEGVPVSIMEAVSSGIPVIATDVGGTSEVVNQELGFLIPSDSTAEQLASMIHDFYFLDKDIKLKMRESAFRFWEANYNGETNYLKFAEFLRTLQKCNLDGSVDI